MTPQPVQESRIKRLNNRDLAKGNYVLYWMQQSQRFEYNHALEYAIQKANRLGQGVLVVFGLMDDYPEANLRHYAFMLEGLRETQKSLIAQGIKMVIQHGSPADIAILLGKKASLIVCDGGYLRHQKAWRKQVARVAQCCVTQIESDDIIPLEVVSNKAEYAARTIRPKIHRHLESYLVPFNSSFVKRSSLDLGIKSLDLEDINKVLNKLSLDRSVDPVSRYLKGGTSQAKARLDDFLQNRFDHYIKNRNQPQTDDISHMSPYLHFGQISPLFVALKVKSLAKSHTEAQAAYLEELIVRRELAMNFVNYTPGTIHSPVCPHGPKRP